MAKQRKKQLVKPMEPQALVAISYNNIYNDNQGDVNSLIAEIPTIVLLKYVLTQQLGVHFSMDAYRPRYTAINKLCQSLSKPEKSRLRTFLCAYPQKALLLNTESTLQLCYESIRNYVSIEDFDDDDIEPNQEELRNIYKAYLKCNEEWTEKTRIYDDPVDTLIMIDVPNVEFKFHKDFKSAVYKAMHFFNFCEKDSIFSGYLTALCNDLGVHDWREYIQILICFFQSSIKSPFVHFDDSDERIDVFFDQFTIELDTIKTFSDWNHKEPLKYLRDHFILRISRKNLLVLSPDFVVDKIYQGLKFMMYNSIEKHNFNSPQGRPFKDFGTFTGLLGNVFSEENLIGSILEKSLKDKVDKFLSKRELKNQGIIGETDFYIRIGRDLIMIEYKDVMISDDIKNSGDIEQIKNIILDRICKYEPKRKKGFGQLLENFSKLIAGSYNKLDAESIHVNRLFPVIVTTDPSFSSIGVNAVVIKKAAEIIENNRINFGERFISIPIIVDLDTIINISYALHQGSLNIIRLLDSYLIENKKNLLPFKTYVWEKVIRENQVSSEESKFLFNDMFCTES